MNLILLHIILISMVFCSDNFELDIDSKKKMLNTLYSNEDWKNITTTNDSIYLSQKFIEELNFNAIKVEKVVDYNPQLFTDILMNVNDYKSFLTNAKSFKSKVISSTFTDLIAYQHIAINVPFIDDREYYFFMSKESFDLSKKNIMCFWVLLDPQKNKNIIKNSTNHIYLKEGAGIWKWEMLEDLNSYKISYILSMHPGGDLPDFLIKIINQKSIITLFRDVYSRVVEKIND